MRRRMRGCPESEEHPQGDANLFTNFHCFSVSSNPATSGTKNIAISATVIAEQRICCFRGPVQFFSSGFSERTRPSPELVSALAEGFALLEVISGLQVRS
jgi:hypothetical protein